MIVRGYLDRATDGEAGSELLLVKISNGRTVTLPSGKGFHGILDVTPSPDGKRLVFTREALFTAEGDNFADDSELWTVPVAGGSARRLPQTKDFSEALYAPDGTLAACSSSGAYTVNPSTGAKRRLRKFELGCLTVAWAPDSSRLLLQGDAN